MTDSNRQNFKFNGANNKQLGVDTGLINITASSIDPNLFEHTLNSISECLFITDIRDKIIFVNQSFVKAYGYSKDEIIGKPVDILRSHKNDPSVIKDILPSTLRGEWHGEIFNKRKDGTDFLISLKTSIVKDELKNPVAIVSVAKDLTQDVKFEEDLRDAEDKYRALFLDLKDAIYESTPEGKIIDINPSGLELFGFDTREGVLNVDIAKDLYLNPEDRKRFKEKLEKKGYVKNYEINIKNNQGEERTVLETAAIVRDRHGKIKSYRGILRDITDSKKSDEKLKKYLANIAKANKQLHESELKLKEMNSSKDKFFSIIAHDLRSPFSSLIGLSEILLEDSNELSRSDINFYASEINSASKNILKLLENLLNWARIQTDRMNFEPININLYNLVSASLSLLIMNANKKKIRIINQIPNDQSIFADHTMIQSIIQNLISNAIKFTHQSGKIEISSKVAGDSAEISVKDNGVGITEKNIQRLFKIDHHITSKGTADEKGSGLGLILCKELIQKNGGDIWITSKEGEGSVFTFSVPQGKLN